MFASELLFFDWFLASFCDQMLAENVVLVFFCNVQDGRLCSHSLGFCLFILSKKYIPLKPFLSYPFTV